VERHRERAAARRGARRSRRHREGRGTANLLPPSLPLAQDPAVTVQLRSNAGQCWGAAFTAPASRNDAAQFKDTLD